RKRFSGHMGAIRFNRISPGSCGHLGSFCGDLPHAYAWKSIFTHENSINDGLAGCPARTSGPQERKDEQ
ncbi:MAG: hypothetical protein WC628_10465, partial [Candidatus Omnitrophota bacterium]